MAQRNGKKKSWADTEQTSNETLSEILGIQNINIKGARRVEDKKTIIIKQLLNKGTYSYRSKKEETYSDL